MGDNHMRLLGWGSRKKRPESLFPPSPVPMRQPGGNRTRALPGPSLLACLHVSRQAMVLSHKDPRLPRHRPRDAGFHGNKTPSLRGVPVKSLNLPLIPRTHAEGLPPNPGQRAQVSVS